MRQTPQAGAGFREASARTERAVAALLAADRALAEAEGRPWPPEPPTAGNPMQPR